MRRGNRYFFVIPVIFSLSVLSIRCDEEAGKRVSAIVLQPDGQAGKDALLRSSNPETNFGDFTALNAGVVAEAGPPLVERALLEFDLSGIPDGSEILLASLSLWHNPDDSAHTSLTGPNTAMLWRVTSAWDEHTVTWDAQPASSILHQVILNSSSSPDQDYPDLDVTILVQDMVDDKSGSFGFLLLLEVEEGRKGLYFASSDHSNPALHPRLYIRYLD